jgi:hypothetical protein
LNRFGEKQVPPPKLAGVWLQMRSLYSQVQRKTVGTSAGG